MSPLDVQEMFSSMHCARCGSLEVALALLQSLSAVVGHTVHSMHKSCLSLAQSALVRKTLTAGPVLSSYSAASGFVPVSPCTGTDSHADICDCPDFVRA